MKIFNFTRHDIFMAMFVKFINKNNFLFNQTIIKIDTHIELIEYNKKEKIICKTAHIRNIIQK